MGPMVGIDMGDLSLSEIEIWELVVMKLNNWMCQHNTLHGRVVWIWNQPYNVYVLQYYLNVDVGWKK